MRSTDGYPRLEVVCLGTHVACRPIGQLTLAEFQQALLDMSLRAAEVADVEGLCDQLGLSANDVSDTAILIGSVRKRILSINAAGMPVYGAEDTVAVLSGELFIFCARV